MKILVAHPIHPGQFGAVAAALAREGADVTFLCRVGPAEHPGYRTFEYALARPPSSSAHPHLHAPEYAVLIGQAAARVASTLKKGGYFPNLIIGHASFGELSFLPEIFPGCPILAYAEYFYHSFGADVGFDPEMAVPGDDFPRIRLKNAITLSSLDFATAAYAPTQWQKDTFPSAYQEKIHVIHDGINTADLQRMRLKGFQLPNGRLVGGDRPLITFSARSLEYYRGFHKFWPALVEVLSRNSDVEAVVVGGDDTAYGPGSTDGESLRERMLELFPADLSRVHFVPSLDRDSYIGMLQNSTCHVYLTYPFIPSWSVVEALACGTPLIAADVGPVRELVGDGTCQLVDFFDIRALAAAMENFVRFPKRQRPVQAAARKRAVEVFDFERHSWPALRHLINQVTGQGPPPVS